MATRTSVLTDAVSFALMRQRGMDTAFAFDAHFSTAGFVRLPVCGFRPMPITDSD